MLRLMTTLSELNSPVPYLDLPAQMRCLRKEIDAAIARTLDNCSFCLGPDVAQFEKDFARFCQAEYCIGLNSGTSALHVAMLLCQKRGAVATRSKRNWPFDPVATAPGSDTLPHDNAIL